MVPSGAGTRNGERIRMKNLAGIVLAKEMNEKGDNFFLFNVTTEDVSFYGEVQKAFKGNAYQCLTDVAYNRVEPSLLIYEDFVPRFTKTAFQEYFELRKEGKDCKEFLSRHPEINAELNRARHYDGPTVLYEGSEYLDEKDAVMTDLERE